MECRHTGLTLLVLWAVLSWYRPVLAGPSVTTEPWFKQTQHQLLSPAGRTALLGDLKARGAPVQTRIFITMYHSMLETMRGNQPARHRIELGQTLSKQFGEFAREVRRVPGMPTSVRVAFGRTYHRFLKDDVLLQEFAREREQQHQMAKVLPLAGMVPNKKPAGATAPKTSTTQVKWQIPDPVKKEDLKPGGTTAVTYSMASYKTNTTTALESYEKQARRWRLVQSHAFSPAFVEKQRAAFDAQQTKLERTARALVGNVPRLTESKLRSAFVWPESPVRVERVAAHPPAVTGEGALWKVNGQGLDLRRTSTGGVQLNATFETSIQDKAVLQAVKQSIETVWTGPIRVQGSMTSLRTTVQFRPVSGDAFTAGSLRLVEGTKNCANSDRINLARCFRSTTPAHEFGHILGLKDAYQVFYDPHARAFVEVQNRATLMGGTAPASMGNYVAACRNLLQRKN